MQPSGCPAGQAERKFDLPVRKQTGRIFSFTCRVRLKNYCKFEDGAILFAKYASRPSS